MTQVGSLDVAATMQEAAAALSRGDATRAKDLLDPVIAVQRADASTWLMMAHARATLGDEAGKIAALDQVLALEPNELRALIGKADHLATEGDLRGAAIFYRAALQHMPNYASLPPQLQEALRRAQAANQKLVGELEDFVRAKLERGGFGASAAPPRFTQAVDVLFGKRRVYAQQPRYLYYPGLPQIEFYERAQFPWLDAVEAAADAIRDELRAVIGGDFKPYVKQAPGRPRNDQMGLLDNPNWSALFLYKDGVEQRGAARCPRTLTALAGAPLTRIPNRTPSVLFSKLAAGAHIPPHTGMLNARLICHLPLIAPQGCEFRVGGSVRPWVEGKAWVFDDTIEHEAWNRSREDRYVLLFDVWRPELSEEERASVSALCQSIDAFGGASTWDA